MPGAEPAARLAAVEAVFNALAHAARRQILLVINFRGGEMTAGDIAGRFAHAWPTTTRHLRVLEAAGLLTQEKRGRTRVYKLARGRFDVARDWLAWFEPGRAARALREATAKPARRPRK